MTPATQSSVYGARPVPVASSAPAGWAPLARPQDALGRLRAAAAPVAVPRLTDDDAHTLQLALGPLRSYATAPVVGVEGGAGRTTVARLLGRAFASIRKAPVAAVDAVPLWGGLSAALAGAGGGWSVNDVAAMRWSPPLPNFEILQTALAPDGPVPTVTSPPASRATWSSAAASLEAIRRVSTMVDLTVVDTVADPLSDPVRQLIWTTRTTPVWVCTATREGLWGVGEAISYYEKLGAQDVAARSLVAVVGHRRRWPAEAAAAEVQLTGRGLEVVRVPRSASPLTDRSCARAGLRLLAAVATRSG